MAQFTKELRQEIVREFAVRHNGTFNPALFLAEVRRIGEQHPAFEWFEWDEIKAANEHQLWQAREFALGLKVSFQVEEVGRKGVVTVRTTEMPMVISPVVGRKDGGGYFLADPSNDDHQAEHCRQAAASLRTWLNRYEAAVFYAGQDPAVVRKLLLAMEAKQSRQIAAE